MCAKPVRDLDDDCRVLVWIPGLLSQAGHMMFAASS
jgi:hypothetical protein